QDGAYDREHRRQYSSQLNPARLVRPPLATGHPLGGAFATGETPQIRHSREGGNPGASNRHHGCRGAGLAPQGTRFIAPRSGGAVAALEALGAEGKRHREATAEAAAERLLAGDAADV